MRIKKQSPDVKRISKTFILSDGRKLGYKVVGEGRPVLYFHGTASSRLEVCLFENFAKLNGLSIAGVDRPGYGISTYKFRQRLTDFAEDVNQLVDFLNWKEFSLLSWSGGGPFLLSYMTIFPKRVTSAVIASSPSLPFSVSAAHNNNQLVKYLARSNFLGEISLRVFRHSLLSAHGDIDNFLKSYAGKQFSSQWLKKDNKFLKDRDWSTLLYDAMKECFRSKKSIKTILQEHTLFSKNFDPPLHDIIEGEKIHIWQGTEDGTCRLENGFKLARQIQRAHMEIFEGLGHCAIFENLEKLAQILFE